MEFQTQQPRSLNMGQLEPILVFVVRVNSEKDAKFGYHKDRLNEMIHMHEMVFGQLTSYAPREFTFIHESEKPLAKDEEIIPYFSKLLKEQRDSNRELIVAIGDWDGLTSNKSAFLELFQYAKNPNPEIRLHVLPRDTNLYVNVNVGQVCSMLTKKINPNKMEKGVEVNSVLFLQEFKTAFKFARVRHAPETIQMLRETCPDARPRNSMPMAWYTEAKKKRDEFFANIPDESDDFSADSDSDSSYVSL